MSDPTYFATNVEFFCNKVSWVQQIFQALFTHTFTLKVKSLKTSKLQIKHPHCCFKKSLLPYIFISVIHLGLCANIQQYMNQNDLVLQKLSMFTHCVREGTYLYVIVDAVMWICNLEF